MDRDSQGATFCVYTDGRAEIESHPFGRLGVSKERRTVSLAADRLRFVAGIGHTRYAAAHSSLPEHVHPDCIELHYCLRGSIEFEIEGRLHTLLPGEVCLTQPDMRHRLVSNAKGHQHYWLLLRLPSGKAAPRALGLPAAEARELCRRLAAIRRPVFPVDGQMKRLFGEVFEALDTLPRGIRRTLVLRTTLLRLFALLVRDAERQPAGRAHASPLTQLVDAIRQHPERQRAIEGMARSLGLSESRFTLAFKRLTGFPPAAFIAHCRIQAACRLLANARQPIAGIAHVLGYSSAAHFSAQFRLFCGMSPRDYRKSAALPPRPAR